MFSIPNIERIIYAMKQIQQLSRIAMAGLLLAGTSTGLFAQEKGGQERDRKAETTMTGCLNKDADGFQLTDEKSGSKVTVSGSADLEKHAANHKVTLTGTAKPDATGKSVFEVTKIQHMGTSCKP